MKTQDQINDTKIILKFMGIEPYYNIYSKQYQYSDGVFFSVGMESKEDTINAIADYSKYYISWDWLMPVIQKCYSVMNKSNYQSLDMAYSHIIHYIGSLNISEAFRCVTEFIKMYDLLPHGTTLTSNPD